MVPFCLSLNVLSGFMIIVNFIIFWFDSVAFYPVGLNKYDYLYIDETQKNVSALQQLGKYYSAIAHLTKNNWHRPYGITYIH